MKYYVLVICGVLCWAVINGFCIKGINVPSTVLGTLMSLVGVILFSPWLIWKRPKLTRRQVYYLLGLGLSAALNNSFFYAALKIGTVYNVVLIHYFASVLAIVWLALVPAFKEKLDKTSAFCVLLGITGLVIMSGVNVLAELRNELWLYYSFLSALFYSFEIILSRLVSANVDPVDPKISSFVKLLFQALIMPFIGIFVLEQKFQLSWKGLPQIVLAGLLLFVSFIFVFSGLKKVPVKHFAVLGYLDRIGAIIIGVLIWDESFGWNIWIGGSLVLLAELPIIFKKK